MADVKKMLGKRIRSLRRIQDLSQEEFAEKANISGKYIGEIERGQANISIEILEKISQTFEIEFPELFDFGHEINRKQLMSEITALLKKADDKELQRVFRVVKSVLM